MKLTIVSSTLLGLLLALNGCGGSGGGDTPDEPIANIAPTALAGADKTTIVNNTISIQGRGTDSDGTVVSYLWTKGTTTLANTATFDYPAPNIGTDILTLTVTDDDGATNSDTMRVTVNEDSTTPVENIAPSANAGADKTTIVNTTINIVGTATDSDGTVVSYVWKKGTTTLAKTATFSYTPTTVGTDILTLTVTDNDGATNSDSITITVDKEVEPESIHITESYQVESLGQASTINTTISIDTKTPKSLYLLLSNYNSTSTTPSISHNAKVTYAPVLKAEVKNASKPTIIRTPEYVRQFNANIPTLLKKAEQHPLEKTLIVKREDSAGETDTFYLDSNGNDATEVTAKKIVSNIHTNFGDKTLNIWVSNNSFGEGCGKAKCVTQEMVDALADSFLQTGLDNDVYDWVTNIYGEAWGDDAQDVYANLITSNDEITILLTDIEDDNSDNGGVVGYFWAKDNYKSNSVSGSNERVMFYIDSVMFANGDGSWDINDFWPKEMISTLAHEFQHMIHYYQKTVLLTGDSTDTWIDEMLAETTEELVATKIQHTGPRGVAYTNGSAGDTDNTSGRYPLFNENNTLSLPSWNSQLSDYSRVNAFGAFLTRNYGGAKLLHDVMHNSYTDEQAIVDAVNKSTNGGSKTFDNLLTEWGVAVLLSDHENLEDTPFYNTGDFTEEDYNGTTYKMGSINFFNYSPAPTIYTRTGTIAEKGNYYYKIGDNLTGEVTVELELNGQTEVTLIAK